MVNYHKSRILIISGQIFKGLVLVVGYSFWLHPTLNTSPEHCLQKVFPCRHPCHAWEQGLGTQCEVISPNLHAVNG